MEYESGEMQPNPTNAEATGFFRRMARAVINRLLPPESYTQPPAGELNLDEVEVIYDVPDEQGAGESTIVEPEPEPMTETTPTIMVRLSKKGAFFVTQGEAESVGPLTTRYKSPRLFFDLARLYLPAGKGEHSVDEIAAKTGYKSSSVVQVAGRLAGLFPPEVVTLSEAEGEKKKVHFGNLALASTLSESAEETQAMEDHHKETPEQINKGKVDLLTKAHAIITTEGANSEHFYLPLHTPAAMIAARVIESIKHMRKLGAKRNVPSAEVAEHVWQKMTLAERQLFVDDEETVLLSNAWAGIEALVLQVLRRLTWKLMLTHEPRGDHFTLLDTKVSIRYNKQRLTEKRAEKLPNLRPIIASEQVAKAPKQAEQAECMELARAYMRQARRRAPIENQDAAIDMLDFIMSQNGHWAVKAVAGERGLFRTHDKAMHAMHSYLRSQLRGSYGPAYKNNLISGHRLVRRRGEGGMRQVGGAIPGDSNWVLGKGMREFFGDTVRD